MGTTLQNGVYLPNEGERNCYAGLKTNWEILDQKVADITALQQAVAGALHREIVASLPTTDIDPNTIYMILSGTSATENVYDEFMYVNNAWELIGTSATDLTNYYTKGDVDGLLLLKANASDLTSHTGDTTIHVTSADKSKWNTVALIKQLRLVNTQVGSATTIAFANIDDTNGIKVGDKCMDLDAKLFEITAVDTTNQTVTVGSALIDIALDANVVHTSGNETVGGNKTFSEDIVIGNSDTTQSSKRLVLKSYKASLSGSNSDTWGISFNAGVSYVVTINASKDSNGTQGLSYSVRTQDSNNNIFSSSYHFRVFIDGNSVLEPGTGSVISLGRSTNRWSDVQTNKVNGLTPSSLSMPDLGNAVDISGYITDLTGSANIYSPPANGYIVLRSTTANVLGIVENTTGMGSYSRGSNQVLAVNLPVVKNSSIAIYAICSSLTHAKFIPCQGNI